MSAENRNESRQPDYIDPLASPSELSLSSCCVSRPAGFGGGVEIVVASPERRVFPTRVSESLGICIKTGPSHDVRTRVESARSLLARGVASSEVADATGFADQAHLGRVFKWIVGLTPNEYARRCVR